MTNADLPADAARPVQRGHYFPRHRARVIERDNLYVIEFVPAPRAMGARAISSRPALVALCGGVFASAFFVAHLLHFV